MEHGQICPANNNNIKLNSNISPLLAAVMPITKTNINYNNNNSGSSGGAVSITLSSETTSANDLLDILTTFASLQQEQS